MLSLVTLQTILGIKEETLLNSEQMVKSMKVTFHPKRTKASVGVVNFGDKLSASLRNLGTSIIPFDQAFEKVPTFFRLKRFIKYAINDLLWIVRKGLGLPELAIFLSLPTIIRLSSSKRLKKGVTIVCFGEQEVKDLAMMYITNFKTNSVITIIDFPLNISETSSFSEHFDTAMELFAHHMTNLVIAVSDKNWMLYNFNGSHPIFSLNSNFEENILKALVPKIVAPISPHKFRDFSIVDHKFNADDEVHRKIIEEMKKGALLFESTKLYPKGKKIDDLPFRHDFHRLIGRLHLDSRSGMSYGFLSFQMPTALSKIFELSVFKMQHPSAFDNKDYFIEQISQHIYIKLQINNKFIVLAVPDVWVMTLRSGSDKTHFDAEKDLIKIGLTNGKMLMQFPQSSEVNSSYKPSFDTKVILAHALGNAIIASILNYVHPHHNFSNQVEQHGVSISHWHGYFNEALMPMGIKSYGRNNPHVSCSSPQSAIYALEGKLCSFLGIMKEQAFESYNGDAHIEPHHGINITFPSLSGLANYILGNQNSTELGNKYL